MKTYKSLMEELNTLHEEDYKAPKSNMATMKKMAKEFPFFHADDPVKFKKAAGDRADINKVIKMVSGIKTKDDVTKVEKVLDSFDTMVREDILTALARDLGTDFVYDLGWDLKRAPEVKAKNWKY